MPGNTILVVDDSDDARVGLLAYLKTEGYIVEEAESGERAVELVASNNYDIVLSDLKMQNIDGIGVLKEVKKINPRTEVIIMTAFASIQTAVNAIKLGAFDYIAKPLNLDELSMTISKCLEKQHLLEEVDTLRDVVDLYVKSKSLTSITELDELLSMILKLACDSVNADGSSLMLYEKEDEELVVKVATGTFHDEVIGKRMKPGERFAGKAAASKSPILQEDVENEKWFKDIHKYEKIYSGMSIPMMLNEELLGVINLKRTESEEPFTSRDVKLATIFAEQASYAVNNAWVYQKITELNDAKSEFMTNISHELKTPLMSMKTALDLILSGKAGNPGTIAKELLGINTRGVSRMMRLVNSVMDFSKIDNASLDLHLEKTDIIELIKDIVADDETLLKKKRLAVDLDIPSGPITINADSERLMQVFENILVNAINFSPFGEIIKVELESKDNDITISVIDKGPGIPKSGHEKIFERYHKLESEKQNVRGLGIGLALAKNIVELHNGTIGVESEPGKGSKFYFTIPVNN